MTERRVDVISGRPLIEGISDALTRVESIVSRWGASSVISHGEVASAVEGALGQSVDAGLERIVVDLIREAVDNADSQVGASPASTATLIAQLIRSSLLSISAGAAALNVARDVDVCVRALRVRLSDVMRRPRATDIDDVVRTTLSDDPDMADMVVEALEMTGLDGRIFFEVQKVPTPQVELRSGYCFDTVRPLMSVAGGETWEAHDVRVACIDGFIETVAEIDGLLTAANELKEPLVIFARQFKEEVLRTLAVNIRRGTLNVMPVVVPFDAESANVLKDVAVASGGDVVSSLEGRLISTIDFNALPVVMQVQLMATSVTVHEDSTADDVTQQVQALRRRMATDELAAPFLMRRARSLTSRTVFIRMPDDDPRRAVNVDRALKRVRSAISRGVVPQDRLRNLVDGLECEPAMRQALNVWVDALGQVPTPVQALDSALVNAAANARLLATTGAMLT